MDTALKALAEPRRREILRLIWSEELPASQIAARFEDITRSAVSQHLGVLRGAELITERRDGTRRLYRANHAEMAKLRTFLDGFWANSLDQLKELAEAAERTSRDPQTSTTPAASERAGTTERTQPWPN
jgi:DNA-binding transcriptional ArsR family regulator